jgi:hypothetical protein
MLKQRKPFVVRDLALFDETRACLAIGWEHGLFPFDPRECALQVAAVAGAERGPLESSEIDDLERGIRLAALLSFEVHRCATEGVN